MENNKITKTQHNHVVHIDNRGQIEISGVTKVDTFNEDNVILHTIMGTMNIRGKGMKVNKLNVDNGDMLIIGTIDIIQYFSKDKERGGGLLKKLFK